MGDVVYGACALHTRFVTAQATAMSLPQKASTPPPLRATDEQYRTR
jgi:hypothetical protein